MAISPSHKFGQIIGLVLELAIFGPLSDVAKEYGLYLDYQHPRPVRSNKSKVEWHDLKDNCHDLDFVLEENGSETILGTPRAFIETAWRRYTKHSRNKAQEIQAAVLPLAEAYHASHPFLGVVLAGDFTPGSLTQLKSNGFVVLYYSYEQIVDLFKLVGIDAAFDQTTPDQEFAKKVGAFERLAENDRKKLVEEFRNSNMEQLAEFTASLKKSLERAISQIIIIPLYGTEIVAATVQQALEAIQTFKHNTSTAIFVRLEIIVRYTNGNEIKGAFKDQQSAIAFLRKFTK